MAKATRKKKGGAGPAVKKKGKLKFIPLGGLGEIGKNIFALEYDKSILVVDCGLMFPDDEMLGIDFVIPDTTYLEENREKIVGMVLTHGHEDHIGGLPFVLSKIPVPLFGTKLTLGMVGNKMAEWAPELDPDYREIEAGDVVEAGPFRVRFIAVCHSIPDGVGLAIETPVGTVVHTGDFKLDPTPVDGRLTGYDAFSEEGRKGVLLLLSDSTNVERSGFTESERALSGTLDKIFRQYRTKRIIIASFASNLHRVQQVVDAASRFNRKIAFVGRSMLKNVELARNLGYLHVDDKIVVDVDDIRSVSPGSLVVMTTGSQGEPFSGLVLMSRGEHRVISLSEKDVVAIFATPVPGNEKLVSKTIDRLFACGCDVLYEKERGIHVSGHAARDELRLMLNMTRPKFFVPVHGEYRHLVRHAELARETGVPVKNAFVLLNGDVLQLDGDRAVLKKRVQAGGIMVDGLALGELQGSILKERRELSEEGLVIVSIVLSKDGELIAAPEFESRGFLHLEDAGTLKDELGELVEKLVRSFGAKAAAEPDQLKSRVRGRIRDVLRRFGRSRPVIAPMITVLNPPVRRGRRER
ncbi:MAG: ribonuclease J [Synergistaceae bacterium]|nr:ribonuclease J [Synergistota bacterium]NLM72012.1 ribonuclease J [Synergistaceae bacterium]